jgi:hypothetical protein
VKVLSKLVEEHDGSVMIGDVVAVAQPPQAALGNRDLQEQLAGNGQVGPKEQVDSTPKVAVVSGAN